jgi:hypothetical protein
MKAQQRANRLASIGDGLRETELEEGAASLVGGIASAEELAAFMRERNEGCYAQRSWTLHWPIALWAGLILALVALLSLWNHGALGGFALVIVGWAIYFGVLCLIGWTADRLFGDSDQAVVFTFLTFIGVAGVVTVFYSFRLWPFKLNKPELGRLGQRPSPSRRQAGVWAPHFPGASKAETRRRQFFPRIPAHVYYCDGGSPAGEGKRQSDLPRPIR